MNIPPPTAGGFIPHPPFSGPRISFGLGDKQASLHKSGTRFPSRPLFFPVIGGGHVRRGDPVHRDSQESTPRSGIRHETAAAMIPLANPCGVASNASARRPWGMTGASPPGFPPILGIVEDPGGPSFSRAGVIVCECVCERIDHGRARARAVAKAGLGPRRSVGD
jgi:hypothetical protein